MDQDPTPDPTPFFSDFKDAKKYFFSYNLPAGIIRIFSFKNFILQALFQSAQHLCEKREGSGPGSIPLANVSGSWRRKNIRIRIPNTVFLLLLLLLHFTI